MKRATSFLFLSLSLPAFSQQAGKPYMTEPHLAPDRAEIAFVSGGDIWRVGANGGEASLLVSHPAEESRPLYSPDGGKLAFVSTRTGGGDIYVLTLGTGELRRLTFEDGLEQLDAWSRDGQWLYYHSAARDIAGMNDVFRMKVAGGTPMAVAADRYTSEFFAAPAPDGRTVAITARGVASRQWWRKGHSHLDTSEIWMVKPGSPPVYERITDGAAKEMWPMWMADGKSFFFVSDRTGGEQIWRQPVGGTSRQVSSFKDGRVLWPSISYDGKVILFERDFGIWKMDTKDGKAAPVAIHLRGTSAGPGVTHLSLTSGFDELAISPDGKKAAFTVRGEIFAAPAKGGGDGQRVSQTYALESQITWAPDSRRLLYVSERNGAAQLFLYDFGTQTEQQITSSTDSDASPRFSPDGKRIAFLRGGRSVWVYDVEKKQERQVALGGVGRQPLVTGKALAWSPDGQWIAFASQGSRSFTNIWVAAAAGETSQPVSFLANSEIRTVVWSPDGKYLLFDTSQRTEETKVARVDLIPRTPRFREDGFRDLFKPSGGGQGEAEADSERGKAKTKEVKIVFEDIRKRLSFLSVGVDVADLDISSDGKTLLLTAGAVGQMNLYTYPLEDTGRVEPAVARQLTSTAGRKSEAQFAGSGKEVFYIERGRIQSVSPELRVPRPLAVTAEMDVDFQLEKREVFLQAWTYQRDNFFDDKFNGANWDALKKIYEPVVAGARSPAELYRLLNLMQGELNASHLGVSGADSRQAGTAGVLGLRFDAAAYETKGQLVVSEVIPLGPAALAGIQTGEVIAAVNGTAVNAKANLYELLQNKAGRRVELTVTAADGTKPRAVVTLPAATVTEKNLLYRSWVEDRRAYVEKASGGKLGYVHMPDMTADSLNRLYIDLDADNHAREGVVIDVRNNNGGFVNAYALDVFARKPYLTFLERGRTATPARSALGQRSLELPTILVTNQHSLSDAEDFSEGYRRLKLGKVVGEPTAGWIVYTWNQRLVDGSQLRMPRVKVFDNDGLLMEMHPRPVDVPVQRPVGESYTGKDTQLDAAVRELLQQIAEGKAKPAVAPSGSSGDR